MEEGKQIIGKPTCSERDEPQLTVYRKMKTNKSHAVIVGISTYARG